MSVLVKILRGIQSDTYVQIRTEGTQPRVWMTSFKVKEETCKFELKKYATYEKLKDLKMST